MVASAGGALDTHSTNRCQTTSSDGCAWAGCDFASCAMAWWSGLMIRAHRRARTKSRHLHLGILYLLGNGALRPLFSHHTNNTPLRPGAQPIGYGDGVLEV